VAAVNRASPSPACSVTMDLQCCNDAEVQSDEFRDE
jgi:hypothetical protein